MLLNVCTAFLYHYPQGLIAKCGILLHDTLVHEINPIHLTQAIYPFIETVPGCIMKFLISSQQVKGLELTAMVY